jgi:hypothetical protein
MAQTFPPAIKALAHQHRLGTPVQIYTHVGSVRLLFWFLAFWVLVDLLFNIDLLTYAGTSKGPPVSLDVPFLVITALLIWGFVYVRSFPDYCRCTEGFLAFKRGNPPKLVHPVRWDDVTSTRSVSIGRGQYTYYVSTRQGKEIQIRWSGVWDRSRDIWYYCDEQLQGKRSRKRA